MATRIVVPDAGQTTDELTLVKWLVKVGDEIKAGDFVADIETDKAVAELESYTSGHVLKLMAEEGDLVETGQTLLWIGEPGEEIEDQPGDEPTETPPDISSAAQPDDEPASPLDHDGVLASPAARALARERDVDLAAVSGTGPDGCIVKRNLVVAGGEAPCEPGALRGTTVPLSKRRRAIATRLQQSVREAPHFYVAMDVDMTNALTVCEASDTKVTVTDLLVKATADTLAEFPQINCRLEGEAIHYLEDINIGIAVSMEDGLAVAVVPHADKLTLTEIAAQSRRVVAHARAGRLTAGVQSTFTVSNLGMYGVKSFSAIVNPPEAAILAVGAIEDKLVLAETGITAVPTVTLTLSSDHRVIDGDVAARFLKALKDRLETASER